MEIMVENIGGISYRAVARVPLIISSPDGIRNCLYKGVVESVDILPTICDLLDIEIISTVQGKSLISIMGKIETLKL
jgi:arylsulfatase